MHLTNGIGDLLDAHNLSHLEGNVLPDYLKSRRWFASKDQLISKVQIVEASIVAFSRGQLLFCEIEVSLGGNVERYQLPLGLCAFDQVLSPLVESLKLANVTVGDLRYILTDAFSLDVLAHGLVAAVEAGNPISLSDAEIRFLSLEGFHAPTLVSDLEVRRLSAEQSNSSLVIGEQIIVKLIRRVQYGINPEVEMIRYLTKNDYAHTPPLLGEIEKIRTDGSSFSMFVVQKFISNEGDAWEYTLGCLRTDAEKTSEYRIFCDAMGRRLAELHEVLSRKTGEDAFAPVEATASHVIELARAAQSQLRSTFEALENSDGVSPIDAKNRDLILSLKSDLLLAVSRLADSVLGSQMTRIHGDFHLGQILVSNNDAYIIDFEGEPSKTLELRRSKSSPMRDVAGLLRSLDYAAAVAGMSQSDFVSDMSDVFLSAYHSVIEETQPRDTKDRLQRDSLMRLFMLEKCAYEICYELSNRPEWVRIPLQGFVDLIANILPSPEF